MCLVIITATDWKQHTMYTISNGQDALQHCMQSTAIKEDIHVLRVLHSFRDVYETWDILHLSTRVCPNHMQCYLMHRARAERYTAMLYKHTWAHAYGADLWRESVSLIHMCAKVWRPSQYRNYTCIAQYIVTVIVIEFIKNTYLYIQHAFKQLWYWWSDISQLWL